jgi:hypothetical protein
MCNGVDIENLIHAPEIEQNIRTDRQSPAHEPRAAAVRYDRDFFHIGKPNDFLDLGGRPGFHHAKRTRGLRSSQWMKPSLAQGIPRHLIETGHFDMNTVLADDLGESR